MKVCLALLLLVAAVCASDLENRARENFVNNVNAARQQRVNYVAEAIGASSGTARKDGVPGVYPGYGYPYGAYPYGAYPYAAGYPYRAAYPYGAYPYGFYY